MPIIIEYSIIVSSGSKWEPLYPKGVCMLAKELMTRTAILVPREMLITDLAHLLREKRIGGVPVIDENNKICGIVTVTDLFNVMNIVRKVGGKRNWFSNFMFSQKTMTVKADGQSFVERVRLYTRDDLRDMLTQTGFTMREEYGNYHGDPISEDAPRTILIATRS